MRHVDLDQERTERGPALAGLAERAPRGSPVPESVVRFGPILVAVVVGALISWKAFGGGDGAPVATVTGQQVASDIARAAGSDATVLASGGSYVDGRGVFVYTRFGDTSFEAARTWATRQLEARTTMLRSLPADDELVWLLESGGATPFNVTMVAPVRQASEPLAVELVAGIAPGAATATDVSAGEPVVEDAPAEEPVTGSEGTDASATGGRGDAAAELDGGSLPFETTMTESFDSDASNWQRASGEWELVDGAYRQTDAAGFDLMSHLDVGPLGNFRLDARLRPVDGGASGGGVVFGLPEPGGRPLAYTFDLADGGTTARWAQYDVNGDYSFIGATPVPAGFVATDWHTMSVEIAEGTARLLLDDVEMGVVEGVADGYVGLVTSRAAMDFDDVVLSPLG